MSAGPGTLGLDPARAADPADYAMSGTPPRAAVRPATREEAAEALAAAARDGLSVVPWGGGVALAREPAPGRFDLALDLRALDRIVEYDPEDFTITAESGATIETLRATLAARGQELPLEGAESWAATLGGVLAANASGPRRLRFGAPYDRVLGARYALADGTVGRSGGRVVKNVAGYAIHRLLCGSRGGLGVILEASLKLAPAPETRAALVFAVDAARLAEPDPWRAFPRLEPAALTVVGRALAGRHPVLAGGGDTVVVAFEDDRAWVEREIDVAHRALGPARVRLADDSAATLVGALADLEEMPGARLTFTTTERTPDAVAALAGTEDGARMVFHAAAGRLHLFPGPDRAQPLVDDLAARGFTLIAARGTGLLEPPVPPLAAIAGMRARLRAALDPTGALALGSRWERGGPGGD